MRGVLLCLLLLTGCATAPSPLTPEQQAETSRWAAEVRSHLSERLYYLRDPSRPGWRPEGQVSLRVPIDGNGRSFTPQVVKSSGEALLDAAAVTTVLTSIPLPAPPTYLLAETGLVTLEIPMRYTIRRRFNLR